jgi:DNA sulfur modification protein DndD
MIIKSIELRNFQCYSGSDNIFEFTNGLNVIIGDNGGGKSKLYDAFYWVLYNQIFDTASNKFKHTKFFGKELVSDKAKFDSNIDESVETMVRSVFENPENFETITFERTYKITKKDEDVWAVPDDSILSVYYQDRPFNSKRLITNAEEIGKMQDKILPEKMRPYMWFQGESVNELIDFAKSETLLNAINVLSDIGMYKKLIDIAKLAYNDAVKDLERETKRNSTDSTKSEKLSIEKVGLIEKIDRCNKEINQYKENLNAAEKRQEDIISSFDDATRISQYEQEKREKLKALQEKEEDYRRKNIDLNRSLFNRKWVLKNSGHLAKLYAAKFQDYQKERLKKENLYLLAKHVDQKMQTRLPINVPQPIYVEDMLKREICLVCNRTAPKESDAWMAIQELLSDPDLLKNEQNQGVSKHDFRDEFSFLYERTLMMSGKIQSVDDDIMAIYEEIRVVDRRRKEIKQDYDSISRSLENMLEDTALSIDTSKGIVNELKDKQKLISTNRNSLETTISDLKKIELRVAEIDGELERLSKGRTPNIYQNKVNLLHDFKLVAESTRERVFHRLVGRLENEANEHFKNITLESNAYQGTIKLVKDVSGKYYPENQDNRGNKLAQLNASNISIIKLAVIMAIISEKKSAEATKLYTFITDAPMSIFGENYTIGFCKSANEVYKQSIIMSKDFYSNKNLRERLLTEVKNLGNVYEITPSLKGDDRASRNKLKTHIKEIKKDNI